MKFGLRYCNTGPYVEPAAAVELVQAGEAAGFESAWTVEHTVVPAGYASAYPYADSGKMAGGVDDFPLPDPLIWMSYVASATRSIRLATGILILPQHNPVVIAKQVASLDYLSGGRVLFGIGVGWLEEEFAALGVPFERRGARTDEYVGALRALWTEDCPSFDGEFVRFERAYCRPQPAQASIPIIVGGHSKAAARRAGRLADGYFPAREAPAELIAEARAAATAAGRDPDALEFTASMPADPALLEEYAALGVSRVLVPVTGVTGLDTSIRGPEDVLKWRDTIARYAELRA
ncbi:MAG: LLM class F420-dependent oxidoreductase [Gammaproteobacteria bacterium]